MKYLQKRGQTDNIAFVFLQDSTTGVPKTGLDHSSAGLLISVRRELSAAFTAYSGSNIGAIATLGTWVDPGSGKCNIKECDATNAPGLYELHFRDAVFDTSDTSRKLVGMVQATGVIPCPFESVLSAFDVQDAVRGALTALPNAVANAAGGLLISTAGAIDMDDMAADVDSIETAILNLNNLSALANLYAPSQLVRPESGSIVYPFTFVTKDTEGHLIDVDSNAVTLTAANSAGTDRSGNLSGVTHAGTGEYTFTYTVATGHTDEGLRFTAAGTVQSATRKAYVNCEVADADSLTDLATLLTRIPGVVQPQTGDSYARLGAPAGGSVSADMLEANTDLDELITTIGVAGAGLSAIPGGGGGGSGQTVFIDSSVPFQSQLLIHQGDGGITIQEVLKLSNGIPVDLTGHTVHFTLSPQDGGAAVVDQAATIVWAAGGVVSYTLQSADTATLGTYFRRWVVTDGGGHHITYPYTNNALVTIQI